jgi:hypothetical protein
VVSLRGMVRDSHPAAFPPGKDAQHPLDRNLGGPQSLCGPFGRERNLLTLPGVESPRSYCL